MVDAINNAGIYFLWFIEGIYAVMYMMHWRKALKAIEDDGGSPLYSQRELNSAAKKDLNGASHMIVSNISESAKLIFLHETKNPSVQASLKSIRRILILFCITPFVVAFLLVFMDALILT